MVEHRIWKRVIGRRTGESPQKNPLWVSLHPATLGETSSLVCPDYSLNCVMFVGLKLKPS